MATRSRTGSAAAEEKASKRASNSIHDHATHLMDEAEQAADSVIGQVRELFESLAQKVSSATHPAAAGSPSEEPSSSQGVSALLENVRDAGEASVRAIGEGFDSVRQRIVARVAGARPGETPAPTAGKKTPVAKKKASKKSAAKKTAARKTVASKKAAAKKPVAKKKAMAKKKVAKKAATKKKATRKKSAASRTGKKKPASRTMARRKRPAR